MYSVESIPFLYLKMGLQDGKTIIDLHANPTDRNQYLHFLSAHAKHTKCSVIFCQTFDISLIEF